MAENGEAVMGKETGNVNIVPYDRGITESCGLTDE
jgi:hypothetical protein